jgi:hypothetical protein
MQGQISALAVAAILCAANLAYAAEATGTIISIDVSKRAVTLDNGSTYDMAMAKGLKLDGMKVGQKITLTYTQSGKTRNATAFEPTI